MSTQAHDGLNQHTWKLAEIGLIGASHPISAEFTITLQFEEESRIHGASACNRYFATYHLDGLHLGFQHIAVTRMMCSEPGMA
jgi:heat shock protein HslJ